MDSKIGSEFEDLKNENEVAIVKLDEMRTYIGNKKILLDLDCC
jgi:hypothetical protein